MAVDRALSEEAGSPGTANPLLLALAGFGSAMLAALAGIAAGHQSTGQLMLWPANAVLLGLLLTCRGRPRDLAVLFAAGALASMVASLLRHLTPVQTGLFAAADLVEAATALLVMRTIARGPVEFEKLRSVAALVVACFVAPLGSAALGAAGMAVGGASRNGEVWLRWYVADALSLALITPAVVIGVQLVRTARERPIAVRQLSEVILLLGLVALVSGVVFAAGPTPLLFTIQPFVTLASFRLRQLGAVAAIAIVAVIAVHATVRGLGPIAMSTGDVAQQYLLLQFFLAVTFITSLPVAAAVAERDRRAQSAHLIADHFKAVVENAGEVIFRTDLAGCWTYLNPAWEAVSGYRIADSLGQPLFGCVDPSEQQKLADWAAPVFAGEVRSTRRLLRFHTAGGTLRWMELSIQGLSDEDGRPMGATGTLRDIDDRKRLEEHVLSAKRRAEERARAATVLAATDELTGLANRRAFLRHLDRQVEAAGEFGWRLTVAMFDVDHFKRVNDRHGHAVGDRVLQLVAQRAHAVCRAGDLIGRLGGEEFGILMPSASAEDAAAVAERLRQAIEAPAEDADGQRLPTVTISIGLAAQEPHQTGSDLLSAADAALYAAKEAGRNRVKIAA